MRLCRLVHSIPSARAAAERFQPVASRTRSGVPARRCRASVRGKEGTDALETQDRNTCARGTDFIPSNATFSRPLCGEKPKVKA